MKIAITLSEAEEDYGLDEGIDLRIGKAEMSLDEWRKAADMLAGSKLLTLEKWYSVDQVSAMLCDACKAGLPCCCEAGSFSLELHWTHLINGVHVPCAASAWRKASAEVKP